MCNERAMRRFLQVEKVLEMVAGRQLVTALEYNCFISSITGAKSGKKLVSKRFGVV